VQPLFKIIITFSGRILCNHCTLTSLPVTRTGPSPILPTIIAILRWMFRCLPSFSTLLLLLLLAFAFLDLDKWVLWAGSRVNLWDDGAIIATTNAPEQLKLSQRIFTVYFLLTHIDTAGFALRLCLALVLVKSKIKRTLRRRQMPLQDADPQYVFPFLKHQRGISPPPSYNSSPPLPELISQSLPNSEVIHTVIVPKYSETLETLQITLEVLASHPRARTQYEVC
jgi:hypothetical protein